MASDPSEPVVPTPPKFTITNTNWLDQNIHSMDTPIKLQFAKEYKELGKKLFNQPKENRDLKEAFTNFSIALKYLILIGPNEALVSDSEPTRSNEITVLYSNLAACQFFAKNWEYVVDLCNEVLLKEPGNIKALYRRGTAYIELQEYTKAQEDLSKALELEPHNSVVLESIGILRERQKAYNDKIATVFVMVLLFF